MTNGYALFIFAVLQLILLSFLSVQMDHIHLTFKEQSNIVADQRRFRFTYPTSKGLKWICTHQHDGCDASLWVNKSGEITEIGHHYWYTGQWHNASIPHKLFDDDELRRFATITRMMDDASRGVSSKQSYRTDILNNYYDSQLFHGWDGRIEHHLRDASEKATPRNPIDREDIFQKFEDNPQWKLNYYGLKNYNVRHNNAYDMSEYKTESDVLQHISNLQTLLHKTQNELEFSRDYHASNWGNKIGGGQTLVSEFFLGSKNNIATYQLFADRFGFQRLADERAEIIGTDSTFKSTPSLHLGSIHPIPYNQILTIHTIFIPSDSTRVIEAVPCIWILMAKGHTKAKDYKAALNYAIWCGNNIYDVDISRMKKRCMADNEIAER
eukprot:132934_1